MSIDIVKAALSAGCQNVADLPTLAEKYQLIGYLVDQGFTLRKIRSIKDPKTLDMVRAAMRHEIYQASRR